MTGPTSQHCWEPVQCQWPHFTGGRTQSPSCYTYSHIQTASSQRRAARSWPPSVGHHLLCGSASPHGHGVLEKQLHSRAGTSAPTVGLRWAAARGAHQQERGAKPPRGQGAFWKGCPQAVLPMAMVATHTHIDTASEHHARPRVAAVTPCRGLIPTFPGF